MSATLQEKNDRFERIAKTQIQEDLRHMDGHYSAALKDFNESESQFSDASIRDLINDYGVTMDQFQNHVEQYPTRVRQSAMATQQDNLNAEYQKKFEAYHKGLEHTKAEIKRLQDEDHERRRAMNAALGNVRESQESEVLLRRTCPYKGLNARKVELDQRIEETRTRCIEADSRLRDAKSTVLSYKSELDRLQAKGMATHPDTLAAFPKRIELAEAGVAEAQQIFDALSKQMAELNADLEAVCVQMLNP